MTITEESVTGYVVDFPRSFGHYSYQRTLSPTNAGCVILMNRIGNIDELYAVKIISRAFINDNKEQMKHLEQESRVIYYLNHPNILKFVETLYYDGFIAIVSEYCENGDLMAYIKHNNGLNFYLKCSFLLQIVEGLVYMHKHNIVHRDLKLENIYITQDNEIKIGDFGCCEIFSPNMSPIAQRENYRQLDLLGTLCYIAPEVLLGNIVDPFKTDVWSFGIICYAMVTRMLPWSSTGSDEEMAEEILGKRVEVPPYVSETIAEVIRRCTEPNPADRPTAEGLLKLKLFGQIKESAKSKALGFGHSRPRSHSIGYLSCSGAQKKETPIIKPVLSRVNVLQNNRRRRISGNNYNSLSAQNSFIVDSSC